MVGLSDIKIKDTSILVKEFLYFPGIDAPQGTTVTAGRVVYSDWWVLFHLKLGDSHVGSRRISPPPESAGNFFL